ncbi:MAG: KilA-N domain-containing protein, partial [Lachnospiraceae bacterium]|nr:KilA-N domain-containing protein [Lachnospiraceae bacterium]
KIQTLEFLRQWENDMNEEFDDRACEELIYQGRTTSLTITPSLWIRKTCAVGMRVKQGKGGGVRAYPEIAADFHLWLDSKVRLALVRQAKVE